MTKGFVTIATGDVRYYHMARNLLRSYRDNCVEPVRFALIADRENEFTQEFDDVVLLPEPKKSWMDKIELLRSCPYDETIFIDADCLVYQDINFLWDVYRDADDFSCFGKKLPLDSTAGWFTAEAATQYPIHFITHLHGMLYFIRRGETIDRMYDLCQQIISDYNKLTFKAFNNTLADEPVYALAMAVLNLKPTERKPEYYCFVPFATKIKTNYLKRAVFFENPTDGAVNQCCIVHWGNTNTRKAPYIRDQDRLNRCYGRPATLIDHIMGGWVYGRCCAMETVKSVHGWIIWFFQRVVVKIKKITAFESDGV